MNEKAHKLGIHCFPNVTYAVARNEHSGRWLGSISIGELYYESNPYQDKSKAAAEVLGYIQQIGAEIINEIQKLKKIMQND